MRSRSTVRRQRAGLVAAAIWASGQLAVLPVMSAAAHAAPCDERCVLVDVVLAKSETFTPTVTLTGGIEPKFQSNIAFRVSGKITQRLVEIGDHVTADQVLARLDPKDQQANLDTAKASLTSAEALLAQAKVAFARQEQLYKSGYTTRPAYDQAQQQLRTQQAAVDSAKAALGTAEEQFGYTDLKAGRDGIVTARNAEVGQVVQAGTTVFTIALDGPRDAVFEVYEALLTNPPASKVVRIALQSDPSVKTTGHVREISPTVDASSGTVRVKIGLDEVPARMSLGAAVVGSGDFRSQQAIVLPRSALFRWNDAPAVWVLDPKTSRVEPKVVEISRFDGDHLILASGVQSGETIVTAGIQFLHPGQVVGVHEKEPSP